MEYLDPIAIDKYNTQLSQLRNDYSRTLANLAYQRSNNQQNWNLGQQQFNTQWDRSRAALPGSFVNRGLLNSGIYKQGLQDYAVDRLQGGFQLLNQYNQAQQGLNLQEQQANDALRQGIEQSNSARAAEQAAKAAQIRTYLGG